MIDFIFDRSEPASQCNEEQIAGEPQEQTSDFTGTIAFQNFTGDLADDLATGRRDPSDIIKVGVYYYVYYTKTGAQADGYNGSIFAARSADGIDWTELSEVIPKGQSGDFDYSSAFTANILPWNGKYYLYWSGIAEPNTGSNPVRIGVAVSNSPEGPFVKYVNNPILEPSDDALRFDYLRVDDSCLITDKCKIYLFYKGRNDSYTHFTSFGAAVNKRGNPLGPFTKINGPNSDKGMVQQAHDSGLYKLRQGVVIGNWHQDELNQTKLYYSSNFYDFTLKNTLAGESKAVGFFREDFQKSFGYGVDWGSVSDNGVNWPYIRRINYTGLKIT